jgi:hypothetical protein
VPSEKSDELQQQVGNLAQPPNRKLDLSRIRPIVYNPGPAFGVEPRRIPVPAAPRDSSSSSGGFNSARSASPPPAHPVALEPDRSPPEIDFDPYVEEPPPMSNTGDRAPSLRGQGHTLTSDWFWTSMTTAQLNAQLEDLRGETIVYGCRREGEPITAQEIYVGKLQLRENGQYSVIAGPQYVALQAINSPTQTEFGIPYPGWVYSFILAASDWNADRALEAMNRSRKTPKPTPKAAHPPAPPAPNVPSGLYEGLDGDDRSSVNNGPALTETSAQDPDTWPQVIRSGADLLNLKLLLQSIFVVPADRKKDHATAKDCLKIAIGIAEAMLQLQFAGAEVPTSLFMAAKTALKRLFLIQQIAEGRNPQFVEHFSNAVEGESRPEWIRGAEIRAAQLTKALADSRPKQNWENRGQGGQRAQGGHRGQAKQGGKEKATGKTE